MSCATLDKCNYTAIIITVISPWGWARGVLERGAILKIKLERGALKAKNKLERGAILELAGARSAEGKIGGRNLERQCQKGSERGALFTPAPPPYC